MLKFYKQEQRSAAKLIRFSNHFRTFLPSSAKNFPGVSAQASLEVATKVFFKKISSSEILFFWKQVYAFHYKQPPQGLLEVKKTLKIQIFRLFYKAKTVECDKKVRSNFDPCGITIPSSAKYFLQVGSRALLKVAIKGSIASKKTLKIQIFRLFF